MLTLALACGCAERITATLAGLRVAARLLQVLVSLVVTHIKLEWEAHKQPNTS